MKVCIKFRNRELITPALLNSGFISPESALAIPERCALELGIKLDEIKYLEEFETAGGSILMGIVPEEAHIKIFVPDRDTSWIKCYLVINRYINEVLISDSLIDELNIQVISFRNGLWKFKDDPVDKVRESELPTYWK